MAIRLGECAMLADMSPARGGRARRMAFVMLACASPVVLAFACRPASDPGGEEVGICGGKPCPGGQMPGASIGNSKMCKCRACAPARCCSDSEYTDEDAGTGDDAGASCTDSYDFDERCTLQVKSCTPRCHEHVWRAKKDERCEDKRPGECCAGPG